MKDFIDSLIGKQVYPIDNSRQFNILTGERSLLAGRIDEPPKLVTIVSNPYTLRYKFMGKEYEGEFVTVLHEGNVYTCYNNFNDEMPEEYYPAHETERD